MKDCCRKTAEKIYGGYSRYLQHKDWKEKREQRLRIDNYKCNECGNYAGHVHHLNYDSIYDEDMKDLISLCGNCHANKHGGKYQDDFRKIIEEAEKEWEMQGIKKFK